MRKGFTKTRFPLTFRKDKTSTEHAQVARSPRSDRARTLLGRYVATEHAHAARWLRSDQARTLLGHYVATEHAHCTRPSTHTARSLRSDRARTLLGRYIATEHAPLSRYVATEHPLLGRYAATEHAHRSRLVRPQKGPPLGSLVNPHRHAFRLVSIGVSVEILRRKQVGLFLACLHSLRSDLSDQVLLWVLFRILIETLFVSSQSEFPLRFYDENKWDSSRLPFTRYSDRDDILTRYSDLSGLKGGTRLGFLPLAIATEMTSSLAIATCQASKGSSFAFSFELSSKRFSKTHLKLLGLFLLTLPPSLRSLSNLDRNVSYFASIEVTIETLRYKKKIAKTYFLSWIQINHIKRQRQQTCIQIAAADKLEYGNQTADKPSSIDTRRPSMHTARSLHSASPSLSQARSLRSDRASVSLGRYVATRLEPKFGRCVETELFQTSV
ncbi:hypothetical protein IGI04_006527 [Brassica rapa subsp. trilocularis]|uniref:Uncharacterized protein n=1 Tax=Brassica rapa subsp. trilocularis TaxID=1813537 RepID=A0ABQ7NH44_BRACM|nr:hypothetical protein IGI04_006527 [Brassica rapa subsp. trilocularis]